MPPQHAVTQHQNKKNVPAPSAMKQDCRAILGDLAKVFPGLVCAVMASVDGREFAHVQPSDGRLNPQKIAAISSSLLALAESFGREALKSRTQYNSIATEHGSIVIVRIPSRSRMHVLCLCADHSENLAMSLRFALDTAETLAATLDTAPPD